MVSKKKIQLMVQAEGYRQKNYREDSFAERYYKNDYIGHERIKSKIWFTLFYAVYLVFNAVKMFWIDGVDMLHFDYQGFVIKALVWYLIFCLIITGKYRLKFGRYHYNPREHANVDLRRSEDHFVRQFITRRKIPKDPPKNGGGGGGTSTIHQGAGGRSFGGGGR